MWKYRPICHFWLSWFFPDFLWKYSWFSWFISLWWPMVMGVLGLRKVWDPVFTLGGRFHIFSSSGCHYHLLKVFLMKIGRFMESSSALYWEYLYIRMCVYMYSISSIKPLKRTDEKTDHSNPYGTVPHPLHSGIVLFFGFGVDFTSDLSQGDFGS